MTIICAAKALNAKPLHDNFDNVDISFAYTSDVLSDVMSNARLESGSMARNGGLLITVQAHLNTVAVASHVGISAIIICNSIPIPDDMLKASAEHRIGLFTSGENQFTVSGKLYALLRTPCCANSGS
jgi:hypothetical protein